MPTPRRHGGAELVQIPLSTPAFKGLNTERSSSLLGPEWATLLSNAVIDESGRVGNRNGWNDLTTTPEAAAFISGIEYQNHDGTVEMILTTATTVEKTTDGATFSDVTGTAVFTDGNWQMVNFNDMVIGFQSGEAPLKYNGSTSSQITDGGSEPTGGAGLSAFGRLWAVDSDGFTLKYCALLDETDWSGTDAGQLSVKNVWEGTDTIQALAAFNGVLVAFGRDNILMWDDGQGNVRGLDPTRAYVVDTIKGIGCIAPKSIQQIEGDIWFMSASGLRSLGRTIQERSNPVRVLSKNVNTALLTAVNATDFDITRLRSVYSPKDRFYLLSLPQETTAGSSGDEIGQVWVFDTRGALEDGSARCLGTWNQMVPTVAIRRQDNSLAFALMTQTGELGSYSGQLDDTLSYVFDYESGWTDIGVPGVIKILKRINGIFFIDASSTITFKWFFDFSDTQYTASLSTTAAPAAEWGEAEWNVGEWSGGVDLQNLKAAGAASGEYIKVGINSTINSNSIAVQQLDFFVKLGRMK